MIEAAFGSPAIRTLGVASGDHQMSTALGSIVIGRLGDNDKAISSMARDMRTYVDEFSFDASVINQVTLKVGKQVRVTDKVTGIEKEVDTLLSPEGEPAEVWIWEGEENGRVYRELVDKYHEIAQTTADTTAVWVSFRPETEESKGQNNRIYKAEKQGDEVRLTSYTVGGSKESMRQFLSDLSQSPVVPDDDLLKNTVFFHPKEDDVSHGKIFDSLTRTFSADEQIAYTPHLKKFHKELSISDSERRLINERKERHFIAHMQDEILKDKDVVQAFGVVAQSVVSLVEQMKPVNQVSVSFINQTNKDASIQDAQPVTEKPIPNTGELVQHATSLVEEEALESQFQHLTEENIRQKKMVMEDIQAEIEVGSLPQAVSLRADTDVEATSEKSMGPVLYKREEDVKTYDLIEDDTADLTPFIRFLEAPFVYQVFVVQEEKEGESLAYLTQATPPEELSKGTLPNEGGVLVDDISAFMTGMIILAGITLDGKAQDADPAETRDEEKPEEITLPSTAAVHLLESIINDTSALTGLLKMVAKDEVKDEEGKKEEETNVTRGSKEKVSVTLQIEGEGTDTEALEEESVIESYVVGLSILTSQPQEGQQYDDTKSINAQAIIGLLDSLMEGEFGNEESTAISYGNLPVEEVIDELIMSIIGTNFDEREEFNDTKELATQLLKVPKDTETAVVSETVETLATEICEISKHYPVLPTMTVFVSQAVGLASDVITKRVSEEDASYDTNKIDSQSLKLLRLKIMLSTIVHDEVPLEGKVILAILIQKELMKLLPNTDTDVFGSIPGMQGKTERRFTRDGNNNYGHEVMTPAPQIPMEFGYDSQILNKAEETIDTAQKEALGKFIYLWIEKRLTENNYSLQKTKKTLLFTRHNVDEKVLDILILLLLCRLEIEKEELTEVMRLLDISRSALKWVEMNSTGDRYCVERLPTFISRYNTPVGKTAYQNKTAVSTVGGPVRYGTIFIYSPLVQASQM